MSLKDAPGRLEYVLSRRHFGAKGLFKYADKLFSRLMILKYMRYDTDCWPHDSLKRDDYLKALYGGNEYSVHVNGISSITRTPSSNNDGYIIEFKGDFDYYPKKLVLIKRLKHGSEYAGDIQMCFISDDLWVAKMLNSLALKDGFRPLVPPEIILDEENPHNYGLMEFLEGDSINEFLTGKPKFQNTMENFARHLGRISALKCVLGYRRGSPDYKVYSDGNIRPLDLAFGIYEDMTSYFSLAVGSDNEIGFLKKYRHWNDLIMRTVLLKAFLIMRSFQCLYFLRNPISLSLPTARE